MAAAPVLTSRRAAVWLALVLLVAAATACRDAAPVERSSARETERPLYISGIEVDPKHSNIVYASTLGPDSVLKSTDAGRTWRVAGTGLTAPAGVKDLRVDALALDPRSPNVLYAGTGNGVYKTSDGATTWKRASTGMNLSMGNRHRLAEGSIYGLAIDPSHTSTVYAAGRRGVWKTTTGGATWKLVLRRCGLDVAIDPRRPATVYVSGTLGGSKTRSSIYKTVDGGGRWRGSGPPGLDDGYFGHPIAVDRHRAGTIYAGGSRGLFASADEGRTWKKVLSGGVEAIALDPSRTNVLYAGTWKHGVSKSEDGGQTWSTWRLDGPEGGVSAIAIARTRPQTIYAGGVGMWKSTDGGGTWHRLTR